MTSRFSSLKEAQETVAYWLGNKVAFDVDCQELEPSQIDQFGLVHSGPTFLVKNKFGDEVKVMINNGGFECNDDGTKTPWEGTEWYVWAINDETGFCRRM